MPRKENVKELFMSGIKTIKEKFSIVTEKNFETASNLQII